MYLSDIRVQLMLASVWYLVEYNLGILVEEIVQSTTIGTLRISHPSRLHRLV
jgi:hypothetical protein